ncbi:DUF1284 domain-containing protein [Ancylobacter radicis]|uniref:DUF1284 domain-containing protein n=1 Tax=Ancylobacter radicis TaxID=2836179 RepID=A0ABS5R7B4_9HYPH|nr:DUF1284 domain-containing protein [Ancylobacter radicis]MBS9476791.1 DUF1284 domain-containing protein [Ancylobacter radicis]
MIRLRAHHLLCLLTYVGRGYSPAFVAQYSAIVARLNAGESAVLVEGPDDICAPMLGATDLVAPHHCHEPRITARDALALEAVAAALGQAFAPGDAIPLDAPTVARLRKNFAAGTIRAACAACQWDGLCSNIAAGGSARTRLTGSPL